jgi:hypothetical protein
LSFAKEKDMREDFSCWLSEPLIDGRSFRRILCIESSWRGTPLEITDDIFRAIAPCSVSEFPNAAVAMPLIGAGDQGYPAEQVLESILRSAVSWFKRGLPIKVLKIVVYSDKVATEARKKFLELKNQETLTRKPPGSAISGMDVAATSASSACDIFLSYSHEDLNAARCISEALHRSNPNMQIFFDKTALVPGGSWLTQIAESLDSARRVVVLYTPDYWASKYCKDEFSAAYIRQNDTGESILFPIYFRSAQIPYLFRTIQYTDCREADISRLPDVCRMV